MKEEKITTKDKVKTKTKKVRNFFIKISPYAIFLIAILLLNQFVCRLTTVSGDSMMPYFKNGQVLLINRTTQFTHSYDRNDVVVAYSDELKMYLIKRIIGLPGETIKINSGIIYINNEPLEEKLSHDIIISGGKAENEITLKENEYFLIGDNRNNSLDSRELGAFLDKSIIGKICFSFTPFGIVK